MSVKVIRSPEGSSRGSSPPRSPISSLSRPHSPERALEGVMEVGMEGGVMEGTEGSGGAFADDVSAASKAALEAATNQAIGAKADRQLSRPE